jgi:3-oxoacyl-[acyl-carrier protein] reductase
MRLQGKNAVVYGASGGMGRAVALSFAKEGAHVFLAGKARDSLRWVAQEIRDAGGRGEVSLVDPLDPGQVEGHLARIRNDFGKLDISFNLTTYGTQLDPRLTGLAEGHFTSASFTRVRSNFVTATAAAREMAYQGNGVILALVAAGSDLPRDNFGGFAIGSAALSEMFRQLGLEMGPRGVQVACLRTRIAPDSPTFDLADVGPTSPNRRLTEGPGAAGPADLPDPAVTPVTEFASEAVVLASGRMYALPPAEWASVTD